MWGWGCSYRADRLALLFSRRDIDGWRATGRVHADAGATRPNSFCYGECYAAPCVPKFTE